MSRHKQRPPHPFLPLDEERNVAITHVARNVFKPDGLNSKLLLRMHIATFRRVAKRIQIMYTPTHATNMQCVDWVNVPTTRPLRT